MTLVFCLKIFVSLESLDIFRLGCHVLANIVCWSLFSRIGSCNSCINNVVSIHFCYLLCCLFFILFHGSRVLKIFYTRFHCSEGSPIFVNIYVAIDQTVLSVYFLEHLMDGKMKYLDRSENL